MLLHKFEVYRSAAAGGGCLYANKPMKGYFTCSKNTLLHCLCALFLHIKLMWLCHPSSSGGLLTVNKNYKQCTGLALGSEQAGSCKSR